MTRRVLAVASIIRLVAIAAAVAAGAFVGATDAKRQVLIVGLLVVAAPWNVFLLRHAMLRARWPWLTGPADVCLITSLIIFAPADAWPALLALAMTTVTIEAAVVGRFTAGITSCLAVAGAAVSGLLVEPASPVLLTVALAVGCATVVAVLGELADESRTTLRRMGALLDGVPGIVWEADAGDTRMVFVSARVREILGYRPWEFAQRELTWSDLIHPDDQHTFIDVDQIHLIEWPHIREFRMRSRRGDWVWLRDVVRAQCRADGSWALRGVAIDISATRSETERADRFTGMFNELSETEQHDRDAQRRERLHDPLTGLPNRTHLMEHLRILLHRDNPNLTDVALLVIDLDQFKEVNDTLGHRHGDEMLREVAARLAGLRRGDDMLARLGGDEFAIVLSPRGSIRAEEAAASIVANIRLPLTLRGLQVQVGASIEIARHPDDSFDPDELLQKAEVAMYQAKSLRRGWTWYSPEGDRFSVRRLTLLGELPRALSNGEMIVHYMPKIDLNLGTVVGVEALVRWEHPELGVIQPDEFIELTEVSGLINELTRQVITRSLAQVAAWDEIGVHLDMAVNLSARDFHDDRLVSFITETLSAHGIDPSRLTLEITESQVVDDLELATEVLLELSSLGVRTSIDDFGTGYSSLTHLRELPVAEIKIDRSFVGQMASNEIDAVIVRSIVQLGHNLNLEVVAEGVEDEWTLNSLRELGCDGAQGYFFKPPLPGEEIPSFVGLLGATIR